MNEVDHFGMRTIEVIKDLVVANHYLQALVVLYSAIDTLAWASLESGDVTRTDFCQWVDTYIQPEKFVGCTAQDIYAARCAIVHSSATESKMSREGRANELWYVSSPDSVSDLQLYAQKIGVDAKVVIFSTLVGAFTIGIMNFNDKLAKDPNLKKICVERMKLWIRFLPTIPTT